MTYEECERLVAAFESATLAEERLRERQDAGATAAMVGECADAIGEFIASMMAQAWKRSGGGE